MINSEFSYSQGLLHQPGISNRLQSFCLIVDGSKVWDRDINTTSLQSSFPTVITDGRELSYSLAIIVLHREFSYSPDNYRTLRLSLNSLMAKPKKNNVAASIIAARK